MAFVTKVDICIYKYIDKYTMHIVLSKIFKIEYLKNFTLLHTGDWCPLCLVLVCISMLGLCGCYLVGVFVTHDT